MARGMCQSPCSNLDPMLPLEIGDGLALQTKMRTLLLEMWEMNVDWKVQWGIKLKFDHITVVLSKFKSNHIEISHHDGKVGEREAYFLSGPHQNDN